MAIEIVVVVVRFKYRQKQGCMKRGRMDAVVWDKALKTDSYPAVLEPRSTPQPQATSPTLTRAAEHHYQTPRSQPAPEVVSYRNFLLIQNTLTSLEAIPALIKHTVLNARPRLYSASHLHTAQ